MTAIPIQCKTEISFYDESYLRKKVLHEPLRYSCDSLLAGWIADGSSAAPGLIDTAHAHFVWLERDGEGSARAYFGEWVDIREKTGGLLNRFKEPRAYLGASADLLPVKRNENHLEIQVKGRGDVRFTDSSVPPREDKEKGGITKTIYYAIPHLSPQFSPSCGSAARDNFPRRFL